MNEPERPLLPTAQKLERTESLDRLVVFADMLGFAALTEANPIEPRMLHAHSRLPQTNEALDEMLSHRNPLTDAFSRFHNSLKWEIRRAEMAHALTAITFSDSIFVATEYLFQAIAFACKLTRSLLWQKVPVRMGIGFGSFAAVRFRSEVSVDGGDHAAQFLGTAVVRAHRAEMCGIKGMRILLHPSVERLLSDRAHNPVEPPFGVGPVKSLECSNTERGNEVGVSREIDYWESAPTKERKAWQSLQDMWAAAPDYAVQHYQATAEAINRMRVSQGEAPLTSLRRRTLPRRSQKQTLTQEFCAGENERPKE